MSEKAMFDSEVLRRMAELVLPLATEAPLVFDEKGVSVRAVDPSHVAMVSVLYTGMKGMRGRACIDMKDLSEFLRLGKGIIEIELTNESFIVKLGNLRRSFDLLSDDIPELKMPRLEYKAHASLSVKDLMIGLRAIGAVGDAVVLNADSISLSVSSYDGKVVQEFNVLQLQGIKVEGTQKAMYSMSFVMPIMRAIGSETVELSFSNDVPVSVKCGDEIISAEYVIAPRVEPQ
jgi:proliferating cell nuclear antigen